MPTTLSDKISSSAQIIFLPKGGGAQKGIGEKFSPDLHTGTGSLPYLSPFLQAETGFSRNSILSTAKDMETVLSV